MSTLQDFLNANPVDNLTEEVLISDRFKSADGKLYTFKIKAMTSSAFESVRKKSMVVRKGGKVELDMEKFNNSIVIGHTLEPDFKDAKSLEKSGCLNPEDYMNKVLLSGEIAELSERIQNLSGFNKKMEDLVEEAKN
ncbi:XkdN-like protein [Paenibacillus sp. N1-5-1-14]|uniref:phage tail assembly chaperone n=1 Tax=Paenibacillus radicibacter TaxID=2972488 RepID=UPI0021590BF9|nr:XkdN-like protein [Paenibacillus radicibacter]MCR8645566.1 XkdN-like protein [Paenibacillus radicibacter]